MIKILEVNSMNREKDLKKYNIRTDLLVESIKDNNNIKPVINIEDKIKITTVKVDEKTEKLINKKQGNYRSNNYNRDFLLFC